MMSNVSLDDARRLVFRVASDPALLRRFAEVADQAEKDPTACARLAEMIKELSPRTSLAELQRVRAEIERIQTDYLKAAPASEARSAERARLQGTSTLQWLRRASVAVANYCEA